MPRRLELLRTEKEVLAAAPATALCPGPSEEGLGSSAREALGPRGDLYLSRASFLPLDTLLCKCLFLRFFPPPSCFTFISCAASLEKETLLL